MSVEAMTWAFLVPLKPCPKSVLIALANRADEDGYCWPGIGDLQLRTGWSRRAIQEAIKYLVDHKLLSVSSRHESTGKQTSNLYQLSLDPTRCGGGAPPAPMGVRHLHGEGAPPAPMGVRHLHGEGAPPAPKQSYESSSEQSEEKDPPSPQAGGPPAVVVRYDKDFEEFWRAYPRKVGKKAAFRAWQKARDKPSLDLLLNAVQCGMRSQKWREGIIPNPATWLNQGRWDDEVLVHTVPHVVPKALMPVPRQETEGEACPPEVASQLSRFFGKSFSFTADTAKEKA